MTPRPILLVADPLNGDIRLHHHTEAVLNREGYLVLRCPPDAMRDFRVLAPCPFTEADVAFLRLIAKVEERECGVGGGDSVVAFSLADRIEAML